MSTSAKEKAGQSRGKRVKAGVSLFPTARGRKRYCSTSSRCTDLYIEQCLVAVHGFGPSYDNSGYLYPGPYVARTKSPLNKQAKHTKFYNFAERI